jgi:DNA-binding winged helix-turn-helix (wHTH) protein
MPSDQERFRQAVTLIRFGDFEFNSELGTLSRNANSVKLQPQPMRGLTLLLARAPEIVTRQELDEYIWKNSPQLDLKRDLNHCIRQIRRALDDRAADPQFIATVPGVGYRFLGTVISSGVKLNSLEGETDSSGLTESQPVTSTIVQASEGEPPFWLVNRREFLFSAGVTAIASRSAIGAMLNSADPKKSKREEFDAFIATASFVTAVPGHLRDLFRLAFKEGTSKIDLSDPSKHEYRAEGVLPTVGVSGTSWINFGHLQSATGNSGLPHGVLSESLSYRLTAEFDEDDKVSKLQLNLFLLNPRIVISRGSFVPAIFNSHTQRFDSVSDITTFTGLQFIADPEVDPSSRFKALTVDLPAAALAPINIPAGFVGYSASTLLARLDLSLTWDAHVPAFPDRLAIPGGGFPAGITSQTVCFYGSESSTRFDSLVHVSRRFALRLEKTNGGDSGLHLFLKPPDSSDPSGVKLFRFLRREYGVSSDFKGVLFGGLTAQWLDDTMKGYKGTSLSVGPSAIAFSGSLNGTASNSAGWYTALRIQVQDDDLHPILGVFAPKGLLAVSISDGDIRYVTLQGEFSSINGPLKWLSGKSAAVSLSSYHWTDAGGHQQRDWGLEIALTGGSDRVLATLGPTDFGSPEEFTTTVTSLAFGPIVTRGPAANDPTLSLPAPDPAIRGYFIKIASVQDIAQIFVAASLSTLFAKAIRAQELRVTGVYLRNQPAQVNNSHADKSARDTALLFDFEADYTVEFSQIGMKSSRSVTTRVEGSGLGIDGGLSWVQVPSGLFDLALDDPGLWELSGIGKILRIVEVSIQKRAAYELLIRLRLAGNFGIVKAGDFVFVVNLSDASVGIQAFPSSLEVDIPDTFKGRGALKIDNDPTRKLINGFLDLTFVPIQLRVYGGVLLQKVDDSHPDVTALVAAAAVEFPQLIPLGASGLGISGASGLYAAHFERNELPQQGAIPPALQWLKDAGGDVVTSIDPDVPHSRPLWRTNYDHWGFGLGLTTALMANRRLLNLNNMLVLALPGPCITIFSKVNLIADPKSNTNTNVTGGILGILEIDFPRREITLGVLAELELAGLVKINAPMSLLLAMANLSGWHMYVGYFSAPVTATVSLGPFNIDAGVYFMAFGQSLDGWPPKPHLAGFGILYGFHAGLKVGVGPLHLQVTLDSYLALSLSKYIYIAGSVGFSGELSLWGFSIGVTSTILFEYVSEPKSAVHLTASVCGHIKLFFLDLRGCISLDFGSKIADTGEIPDLISEVSFVSAVNVAKFGQGIAGPIDGKLGSATPSTAPSPATAQLFPIDAIPVISMTAPPALGKSGFVSTFASAADMTQFNFGGTLGHYVLQDIQLTRRRGGGITFGPETPVRWWRPAISEKGGQATPLELALLTRSLFGTTNALPSSDTLDAWLKAATNNVCEATPEAQPCFYRFAPSDVGEGENETWMPTGSMCSREMEDKIGRTGISPLSISAHLSPASNLPITPATCYGQTAGPEMIQLLKLRPLNPGNLNVNLSTPGFYPPAPIQLLCGLPAFMERENIQSMFSITTKSQVTKKPKGVTVLELNEPEVLSGFHDNCPLWRPFAEEFAGLSNLPEFGNMHFYRIDIDSSNCSVLDPTVQISVIFTASDLAVHISLLAAFKFTPSAEFERYQRQEADRLKMIAELNGMFGNASSQPIPLLEKDSTYDLAVTYIRINDSTGVAALPDTRTFSFQTSPSPPFNLDPYVFASFPTPGENFHYTGDPVGIALGSADILRILAKYSALLRVQITSTNNSAVTDSGSAILWDQGVIFDPLQIADISQPPPKGISRSPIESLPSAVQSALQNAMRPGGSLSCLAPPVLPSGLWIGFDVALQPLTHYVVNVTLVDASHSPLPRDQGDGPFFEWRFATSLYKDTAAYAASLQTASLRNRRLNRALNLAPPQSSRVIAGIEVVSEEALEEVVATALGERPHQSGDRQLTILWQTGDQHKLYPAAVLLESREPLIRQAMLPHSKSISASEGIGDIMLLDAAPTAFSAPLTDGFARTIVGSSFFAILFVFATPPTSPVSIFLKDLPIVPIPRVANAAPSVAVALSVDQLSSREPLM